MCYDPQGERLHSMANVACFLELHGLLSDVTTPPLDWYHVRDACCIGCDSVPNRGSPSPLLMSKMGKQ